jgi:5-methylcytosine-specific restriction endonuclease McrA
VKAKHVLYGNVHALRAYCQECEGNALVIKGKMACCDKVFAGTVQGKRREVEAVAKRKKPSQAKQEAQLAAQDYACLYCGLEFGTLLGDRVLSICWDHCVPYSYSQDNSDSNFVAACQICNGIKSNKMFATLEEARQFVIGRREAKLLS